MNLLKKLPLPKFLLTKKALSFIVVALILGFIFVPRPKQAPLEFVKVQKGTIKSVVSASGTLSGKNSANLKFIGTGKITSVNVSEGMAVTQGQMIASMDATSLQASLQQAQNNLRSAQATVDKTIDDIHQYQVSNNTTGETQTQRQARMSAEATRDSAVDSVKAAQSSLSSSVIFAPFSGTITSVNFVPGQTVGATDIVAQEADFSQVQFDADIDESDVSKISTDLPAEVSLNAYGDQVFRGTVEQIVPQTKTTSSGATVVTTKINLYQPAIHLIPGLNGQVSVITGMKTQVLTIPLESIRDDNTVLVKEAGGNIHPVKIETGLKSDTDAEVTSGLTLGQEVVKTPSLYKGQGNLNPLTRLLRGFTRGH